MDDFEGEKRAAWSAEFASENARRERWIELTERGFNPLTGYFPECFESRNGDIPAGDGRVAVDAAWLKEHGVRLGVKQTFERSNPADDKSAMSEVRIPATMAADAALKRVRSRRDWQLLRFRHDFAYWAATCVRIKDKSCGRRIAFVLNYAQRRLLEDFERQRLSGRPIRTIVLKARQWGGSTLTQIYMAWIQCVHATDWHSLICTQVTRASATIRGMFDTMLATYPPDLWQPAEDEDKPRKKRKRGRPRKNAVGEDGAAMKPLKLAPYQGQNGIRTLPGRRCNITLGSAESQDAVRSGDYALAHLSEVAFWKDTPQSTPADFIRAICGSVGAMPLTMVVLESTANGVGNFFHSEWERSVRGDSDKSTVFVPWYEISIYRTKPEDEGALWRSLNEYERMLWQEHGCSLSQIQWYRNKLREWGVAEKVHAEFPTTADEAFINTGNNVFAPEHLARMRRNCKEPTAKGEIVSGSGAVCGPDSLRELRFAIDGKGGLSMWADRAACGSYVVAVDVGGRSHASDWSVVAVLRTDTDVPEVVAQWRGHTDHDLLAWNAARIARYYNMALLVFESNSIETGGGEGADHGAFLLNELYRHYDNLYRRSGVEGRSTKPGFHTNRQTKQMIVTELIAAVRDGGYVERSHTAADEFPVYQLHQNGTYGAREGYHDDCLMTRAIALHVARTSGVNHYNLASNRELASFLRRRLERCR